jgi:ubiquinone/menaquinone biosynthesis C-methylase UbiE
MQLCADSAREYRFWVERGRRFHCEGHGGPFDLDNFRDQDVLEIGPGWGCNLVSLAKVARRIVGVEVEPTYITASKIIAAHEGIRPPDIRFGTSENIPFGDNEFDRVLSWAVIQYTDFAKTFEQCARVLRPGGQLLISHAPAWVLAKSSLRRKQYSFVARTLARTFWYQAFNARAVGRTSTDRPVYPTLRFMRKAARGVGLVPSGCDVLPDRALLVFTKPRMST